LLSPDVFSGVKLVKTALAAGATPRTLLGDLIALPQTPNWTKGKGTEGKRRWDERKRKWEGRGGKHRGVIKEGRIREKDGRG